MPTLQKSIIRHKTTNYTPHLQKTTKLVISRRETEIFAGGNT